TIGLLRQELGEALVERVRGRVHGWSAGGQAQVLRLGSRKSDGGQGYRRKGPCKHSHGYLPWLSLVFPGGRLTRSCRSHLEQPARVLLQDLGTNLRLDIEGVEIGEPAVGQDRGPVGAEQHPSLKQSGGGAHEDWRHAS